MVKSKNRKETSLLDIVVTDNFSVQRELTTILKKVNPKNNWLVLCCNKSLEFSKKSDGYTDEYKPLYRIVSKEFDRNALSAKSIWIASVPDFRGDYLAFKFNEHIKKDLKLNCSVYRMRLSHLSEESVLNSILNKTNITIDNEKKLKYESYNVIDHAISTNVSKLLSNKFPFNIDIYLHTAIILSFINNCHTCHKVKKKSFYSSLTLYKEEVLSKSSPILCKIVSKKKVKRVSTLESLYYDLSGFVSWYGFASSINEAYARGCITYPTSDTCSKSPKSLAIEKTKQSKKNWGLCFIKSDESLPEAARYIVSNVGFHSKKASYLYDYEYSQGDSLFIHKLTTGHCESGSDGKWTDCGIFSSLGVTQLDLLFYLKHLGFSYKLIPWITYTLVKSGLVVYTSDSTIAITSFGKFILSVLSQNVPILLKEKYVINTLKGIESLSLEDELGNFEFMSQRIDKVKTLTDAAYESIKAPKCSTRCSCGKRYTLTINNNSVFATCSNNKCSNSGKIYPVNISNDTIEVEDDKQ